MTLPLEGIKILDLSRLLPGPFATQILTDFGAQVIKIEDPATGDFLRYMPPLMKGQSVFFPSINRGKKSITLNLKTEQGREIFKNLISGADVVVEGFRPGVMDKLGLGYDVLQEVNPGLIYCAITGYGNSGPYRDKAGHDLNYISYAGITGITGYAGEKPTIPGVQVADIGGGSLWAVMAILLALQARNLTGKGQYCDISMMDGVCAWLPFVVTRLEHGEVVPARGTEVLNGGYACYYIYETSDKKYVCIGAIEPKFWAGFCRKLGRAEYISKQYIPSEQPAMIQELDNLFKTKTRDEWVEWFADTDVCFSPVLSFDEAVKNEHLQQRDMLVKVDVGDWEATIVKNPIKLSATPSRLCRQVPAIGADTEEILLQLGYSMDYIKNLHDKTVI